MNTCSKGNKFCAGQTCFACEHCTLSKLQFCVNSPMSVLLAGNYAANIIVSLVIVKWNLSAGKFINTIITKLTIVTSMQMGIKE